VPVIICLGAFDGYHRGHFSLFENARNLAEKLHTDWRIVTFTPHPRFVLGGLTARLFTESEKALLRQCFGLPEPFEIQFTREFADTEPDDFLNDLAQKFPLEGIVVGQQFRFGRKRSGDSAFLTDYCKQHHIRLQLVPQQMMPDGTMISSTRVRDMVQAGSVEHAAELLGYPYFITAPVRHGEQRGRSMGYPTANFIPDGRKLIPGEGVYAGALYHEGVWHPAAVSVGRNPTFLVEGSLRIEAHVIDFCGNLYGCTPMLVFLKRLRLMNRYSGTSELVKQLALDCGQSRRVFNGRPDVPMIFKRLPAVL
jgi:riboflavin kinase/FMN adenylyltransferase